MSTDLDALELLPAQEGEETQVGIVTGCDIFTYCFDTCTRN